MEKENYTHFAQYTMGLKVWAMSDKLTPGQKAKLHTNSKQSALSSLVRKFISLEIITIKYLGVPLSPKWSQMAIEIMTVHNFSAWRLKITKYRIPNPDPIVLTCCHYLGPTCQREICWVNNTYMCQVSEWRSRFKLSHIPYPGLYNMWQSGGYIYKQEFHIFAYHTCVQLGHNTRYTLSFQILSDG